MTVTKFVLDGKKYDVGATATIDTPYFYSGKSLSISWTEIKQQCINGKFIDLKVGDYKTININGEDVVMQIAGIDTYYNTGEVEIPHHIDWISKDCLATSYQWNNLTVNNGNLNTQNPFMASRLWDTLNNTLFLNFPSELRNGVISDKYIEIETRYQLGSTLEESTGKAWVNLGKLWLPTEYEVFGSRIWGTKGYSEGASIQYPLFANNAQNRIKRQGNEGSLKCSWWLATASTDHVQSCQVDSDGSPKASSISVNGGVPICFRISA